MYYFTKTIERIFHFAEIKGISIHKLSLQIGVSNSYFNKMMKNRASVGSDIIEKILRFYPELNAEWLLTGNGDILNQKKLFAPNNENMNETKTEPDCNQETQPEPAGLCPGCQLRERTIEALKIALDARQGEINAISQNLKDKERLIQFLEQSGAKIKKQTG